MKLWRCLCTTKFWEVICDGLDPHCKCKQCKNATFDEIAHSTMVDGVAKTFFGTFWGWFQVAHVCVRMRNGVMRCQNPIGMCYGDASGVKWCTYIMRSTYILAVICRIYIRICPRISTQRADHRGCIVALTPSLSTSKHHARCGQQSYVGILGKFDRTAFY